MHCLRGGQIHNKPRIAYRYPTTVILIIKAWKLALKAYVYKYIGKGKIHEREKRQKTHNLFLESTCISEG